MSKGKRYYTVENQEALFMSKARSESYLFSEFVDKLNSLCNKYVKVYLCQV